MFRSHQDTVRMPTVKADEKRNTTVVYDCNLCDRGGWLTENDVEIHKKLTHIREINAIRLKNYNSFCSVCMELQDSQEDLISHIKSRHLLSSPTAQRVERQIYICDVCCNVFFNKHLFVAHMQFNHLKKKPSERAKTYFTCPVCLRDYQLRCMWYHYQMHGLPSLSACDICLTNFPNRSQLADHLKTHNHFYTCDTCQFSTTRENYYVAHLKSHSERGVGDVSNKVLANVFMKLKVPCPLFYNVHNPVKGLCVPSILNICSLCREICSSNEEMKLHVFRNHMVEVVEKKRHICVCGREFEHKVVLKQHLMKAKCKKPLDNVVTEDTSVNKEIPVKQNETSNPTKADIADNIELSISNEVMELVDCNLLKGHSSTSAVECSK